MKILVINTGSSSIKYRLFEMEDRALLAAGLIERIGEPLARLVEERARTGGGSGQAPGRLEIERPVPGHREGMEMIVGSLSSDGGAIASADDIAAVGHRVVHGGEDFTEPAVIDDHVLEAIRANVPLAPLHNPANLAGIEVARAMLPNIPHVAVFDTAFHQTLPPRAYRYALPAELYEDRRIRRYGFHGTSHRYVCRLAAEALGAYPSEANIISAHLGNGCSVAAVRGGKCADTSMGLTPLEGLVMGTRSGDVDPSIIFRLAAAAGMGLDAIEDLLNKQSGLRGMAGANDMREIVGRARSGDERAELALDVYCYRIKKYIGAYMAALGSADAIVFTAGVGENSAEVRARSLSGLAGLGVALDPAKNMSPGNGISEIQDASSKTKILIVPTNEELEIAIQTEELKRRDT